MRQPLIAEEYGDFISVSKENIILKNKDSAESIPLKELSHVIIKGLAVSFSTAFILKCLKKNIPIILLDDFGKPYSVIKKIGKDGDLKEFQINFSNSPKSGIFISKLLKQKIRRQHQILHYHIRSLRLNKEQKVEKIENYNFKIFFDSFDALIKDKKPIKEIRKGLFLLEARSSRAYWKAFSKLFPKLFFPGRQKRKAKDPMNKLLNYGYALLSSLIIKVMVLAGIDPSVPLLHHRKELTFPFLFDLMEPFRPINDHAVISFLHKQKRQILYKNGEIRKSVLRRYRKFWFKNIRKPQPWSKSKKTVEQLAAELIENYKKEISFK